MIELSSKAITEVFMKRDFTITLFRKKARSRRLFGKRQIIPIFTPPNQYDMLVSGGEKDETFTRGMKHKGTVLMC